MSGLDGNDRLNGGGGGDTFVYHDAGFGHDVITGFEAGAVQGHDTIALSSGLIADFSTLVQHLADVQQSATITVDASDTIRLQGVHAADLVAADFTFT